MNPVSILKIALFLATISSLAYFLICIYSAWSFFRLPAPPPPKTLQPISVLVPVYGLDHAALENFTSMCSQDFPSYQIVFGVQDENDASIPVVRKLMQQFSERDISLVVSSARLGTNLKVGNLQNMLAEVKYERLIIMDSDIRVPPGYLRNISAELDRSGIGLVTCLYRFAEAPGWPARLEAIGITSEFAAGVLVARRLEGMTFALGATMATTRSVLDSIGGFPALADYLADDFMLGNLIAARGLRVDLARIQVETVPGALSLAEVLKHQVRWARGTRVCRPWGYLGMVLTHGTVLSLLYLLVSAGAASGWILLAVTLAVRALMAWSIGVRWMKDSILKSYFYLLAVRDLISFGIWLAGLFGRTVHWRGRAFTLVEDGKLLPRTKG